MIAAVRDALLHDYNLEIGGGLGALAGKAWRIGLMGHASNKTNVLLFSWSTRFNPDRDGSKNQPGDCSSSSQ